MSNQGIEKDGDIEAALAWFAAVAGDPQAFVVRLERAQKAYREATSLPENRGQDPKLTEIQEDVVAVFLAQAKSLLDDRRSFDFALASETIPWVKQIGRNVTLLDRLPGARQRAARMLAARTVLPDSAMLELVMASNYAADGFDVSFVDEEKGGARTPDMQLRNIDLPTPPSVECKRLTRGHPHEGSDRALNLVAFRAFFEHEFETGQFTRNPRRRAQPGPVCRHGALRGAKEPTFVSTEQAVAHAREGGLLHSSGATQAAFPYSKTTPHTGSSAAKGSYPLARLRRVTRQR